jgi:NOL1/NOP2/fmu family ribosome biogenesis protein
MIPLKFFSESEKERILKQLKQQFGIKDVPFRLARLGKERIIAFSGELSNREILNLDRVAHIEGIGLYFGKEEMDGIRLSIEGSQLLSSQITKNIFNLDSKQAEQWMLGQELNIKTDKRGFFVMKFKEDHLGTGKISAEKISNFIPKSRRLKNKEN